MATIVDYAGGVPPAAAVKADGHVGAVRYLSPPRPGSGLAGKPIQRAEVADYDEHGLQLAFVWQYGKEPSDVMRGARGGELDARASDEALKALGRAGWPVYFAVDFDISLDEWNSTAVHYFRAAVAVLGRDRVGIYGHSRVVAWAQQDGVVADLGGGKCLGWVTNSWGSRDFNNYATLFQRIVDTQKNPGPKIAGVTVDVNDVLHDYWGQRPPGKLAEPAAPPRQVPDPSRIQIKPNPGHRGDPHFLPDVLRAFGVPVATLPGWDKWGMGDFDRIWGVGVHHTGANNTSAEFIARNGNMGGALSSQLQQSRTPPYTMTLCGVGIAWHMGKGSYPGLPTNNANPLLIGIEPQSNGTDPWPAGMLDVYYRAVAAILWYLGHNSSRCISHWEYSLVAQGKWDPGAGNGKAGQVMDMDHFRARVQHYIDHPPFMEGINDMALDLNRRYQFRTPAGYYEGDKPGEGTLEDIWLNTDTHAWVARVNSERILQQLQQQHEERLQTDRELAAAINALAEAIRGK